MSRAGPDLPFTTIEAAALKIGCTARHTRKGHPSSLAAPANPTPVERQQCKQRLAYDKLASEKIVQRVHRAYPRVSANCDNCYMLQNGTSECRTCSRLGHNQGHNTSYVVVCPSSRLEALHRGLFAVSAVEIEDGKMFRNLGRTG